MALPPVTANTGNGFSYPGIIGLAQKSGLPNHPGSLYRPGDPLYHGRGWAVDFMGFSQDALAQYFTQFDTLEIIHRSVKTGKVYGTSNNRAWNPGANEGLLKQHENHLHVAMNPSQVTKAFGGAVQAAATSVGAAGGAGGAVTGATALASNLGKTVSFFLHPEKWKPVLIMMTGYLLIIVALGLLTKGRKLWTQA